MTPLDIPLKDRKSSSGMWDVLGHPGVDSAAVLKHNAQTHYIVELLTIQEVKKNKLEKLS